MQQRRYHPAPPDYGIVELSGERGRVPEFVIYREGLELARTRSSQQAWAIAEGDRVSRCRLGLGLRLPH
jgi:hypothetical protein